MNDPIISITNLNKSYDDTKVLNDLSWQINQGDIVALLGKNGAGKSTLLETIMKLRDFENGQLKIWGNTWAELSQQQKEKIGFVAQDIKGFEWMNVKTFLEYLGGFFPSFDKNYCDQLQSRWGLQANKKIADLSGGQTQILHVIQALSIKPELLILDEPVAHLDPNMRRQFLSELIELSCELNSTVIFSSHIVSDLERVANKVALLLNGKIDHYYDLEELKSSIAHVKLTSDKPLNQQDFSSLINWQAREEGAIAKVASPINKSIEDMAKKAGAKVELMPMSLEDWYLEVSHAAN